MADQPKSKQDENSNPRPARAGSESDFSFGENGEVSENVRRKLETLVPELVKKTFSAGLGALFTTEENVRKLAKDMRVPKEVAGYLVNTAAAGKDEVLRVVAGEMRSFLETVNLSEEIAKMLTTLSFEVKTEVRFIPNEKKYTGVEPDVKAKVRFKRSSEERKRRGTGRGARSNKSESKTAESAENKRQGELGDDERE